MGNEIIQDNKYNLLVKVTNKLKFLRYIILINLIFSIIVFSLFLSFFLRGLRFKILYIYFLPVVISIIGIILVALFIKFRKLGFDQYSIISDDIEWESERNKLSKSESQNIKYKFREFFKNYDLPLFNDIIGQVFYYIIYFEELILGLILLFSAAISWESLLKNFL